MEPRTLILNAWMQPHSIASWQQSIVLLVGGKIDVLEEYDAEVRSPTVSLKIPAVARLRKDVSTHKRGVKFSRVNVHTRDRFRCCYCGKTKTPRELNYDHVLPRSRGGKSDWENVVSSCYVCNGKKGRRTPAEAGLRMHFQPYRPRTLPLGAPVVHDVREAPTCWLAYLEVEGAVRSA